MSGIDKRGEALENKFFHDADLRFKALARRNRQLGLWAAEKLSKNGEDAEAYAKSVIIADLKEAGDNDVVAKIMNDFKASHIAISEEELRHKMLVLLEEAVKSFE